MMVQTEHYYENSELNLHDRTTTPLPIHAVTLALTIQDDELIECRLTFQVNRQLYQHINTEALFNLKPEVRNPLSAGEFLPEPDIQIETLLKPDLLPRLAAHTTTIDEAATYILNLSQEQPEIKGQPVLQMGFQGKNGQWTCYARAREAEQQFVFYSICPVTVPKSKRRGLGEFIARANYGMIIGNFELDFAEGEVAYKTSIDVEGSTLTFPQLKRLVDTNVAMMDQYLPGIKSVIQGDASPEEAIAQIEKR